MQVHLRATGSIDPVAFVSKTIRRPDERRESEGRAAGVRGRRLD